MEPQDVVNARLARYAVTQDARDLWPEVSVSAFRRAQAEIARVTAAVLSDVAGRVPLQLPPNVDARAFGVAASAGGIGPLLGRWCETGRLVAPQPLADMLATHLDHGRRRPARMRQELDRLLVALADRAIEVLVLKGTHTGQRYFPEPGTRPTTDIDLLIAPHDLGAAQNALRALEFVEDVATAEPQRSHWAPRNVGPVRSLELAHADNPWSVDLHMSLDRRQFAELTMAFGGVELSAGEVWREFARPVRVLPQPQLLAYLAFHASSHFYSMTLVRLVELVLVGRRDFAGRPDRWEAFSDLVRRTRIGRFVFPALALAERLTPGSVDPLVLEELVAAAPPRLRRLVRHVTPASAQRLHPYPSGEAFIWLASLKDVLAFLAYLAWPPVHGARASTRQVLRIQWQRIRKRLFRLLRTVTKGSSA